METLAPNPTKIATKWALIYVVVSIVITYTFQFLNIDQNSPAKYLTNLPFIAFCFLAQKEYKDQSGGFVTFGQAFNPGFRYALFTGLLYAVFFFLYLKVLNPDMLQKIIDTQEAALTDKGQSQATIDKMNHMMTTYGPLMLAVGAAITTLIFGCVVAVISAAILRKERTVYDVPDDNLPDATV